MIRFLCFLFLLLPLLVDGQTDNDQAMISGRLELNANFYSADSAIGAFGTPQYDHQLYSADAWLNLNYRYKGFDIGARFDLFNNSALLNPQDSYTAQGIGRWYVNKSIGALKLSGGYLYDQIGSGLIFRAYEERPLLIDNALLGIRLAYDITPNLNIKAFTGKQKQQFDQYDAIIKGINIESYIDGSESGWTMAPGIGIVNRTLGDDIMNQIVSAVSTYTPQDSIGVQYNTYALSLYNNVSFNQWNWYAEVALKSKDVFFDPLAEKLNWNGRTSLGKLVNRSGQVIYTSLSYAGKGIALTGEYKRTQNFTFRTNPFVSLNRGMINFLPPMARVNTYRLTARYNAATQELGEQAFIVDLKYAPSRKWSFNINFSSITALDNEGNRDGLLYNEVFTEIQYKQKRDWLVKAGVQLQAYNQERYEIKPNVGILGTLTPYAEFAYRISRKKSIRAEMQYMQTGISWTSEQDKSEESRDFGNWLFGLVEFSIAPHWTFTISDMYNVTPLKTDKAIHYPRLDVFYVINSNRFSFSYVKQVEGVVCSGGICRLEPAFSGVKLSVNSSF